MSVETKILYYIGDEQTPYVSKINIPPEVITLGDFKAAVNKPNHKFFFRSQDKDFGVVKEEITDDNSRLPVCENRIVAWLVAPDADTISQSSLANATINPQHIENRQAYPPNCRPYNPDVDTHSIASSHRGRMAKSRHLYNHYDSQSTISSTDASTLSYDSRDDTSEFSTCTDTTLGSRYKHRQMRHRFKKRRPRPPSDTTSTYSSSITDSSMSLNILSVKLNMEKYNFLGISIVGQSNDNGDGGIYIGSIMKGGAVAADGRIEPGDMLLQVNDVSFENMTNEDAVRELRTIVHKPGAITLTVAKCWDPNPESNYFHVPKNEPVRPIDPAAWASHTTAIQSNYQGGTPPYSGTHDTSSDNLTSSLPESERYDKPLSIHTNMAEVVKILKMKDSGLDVKTRMWLKITIPDAFIGSDLVDWLIQKVEGLGERKEARRYAASLLKMGYIRHTVNKITFSEQCYYVFGECTGNNSLFKDMATLSLGDSNSDRDSDTLGPLPVHAPWDAQASMSSHHGCPSYSQYNSFPPQLTVGARPDGAVNGLSNVNPIAPPPAYAGMVSGRMSDADSVSLYSANGVAMSHRSGSVSSLTQKHLASFGRHGSGGSGSDQASESHLSCRSSRSGAGSSGEKHKSRSGSDRNSDSGHPQLNPGLNAPYEGPLPPYFPPQRASPSLSNPRPLNSIQSDLSASRQSFQRAMDNPCDYFGGHF